MPPTGSALRRTLPAPRSGPRPDAPGSPRPVDAVLRSLPSHGWTAGWVGRRDRALLVLTQRAGLSAADTAALTVDDIVVRDGAAVIRVVGTGDPVTLRQTDDCLLCGPCALSRWLHALGLAGMHSDGRVVASVIARAAPLGAHSPHVCEGTVLASDGPSGTLVFPADDRWAAAPVARSGLPVPARPVHDLRTRSAHDLHRSGPGLRAHLDVARADGTTTPAPVDQATALGNRVMALLNGLG